MATSPTSSINGSNLMSLLGAGSGVDTKTLAENLVEAERAPQKALLDKKIAQSTAKVSGYAAVNFVLTQVKDAFAALNDQNEYAAISVKNSNPSAFEAVATTDAEAIDHQVEVLSLAKAQRSLSAGFSLTTTDTPPQSYKFNGGRAFTLSLTSDGSTKTLNVAASQTTPAGVVDAINAKSSEWGVRAQLINTGAATNPYKIVLTGTVGANNAFTLSAAENGTALTDLVIDPPATVGGASTPLQAASDAVAIIDGVRVSRSSNQIKDIVKGVTFNLLAPTASAATINLARDTSGLKEKMQTLVTAFNDANSMFNVVTDPESEVETYGATLVNDSTVRTVRQQLRSLFNGTSTTPGTTLSQMWQVGIEIDRFGVMTLDEEKFDAAIESNYDDVVTMMTGNLNNQSIYSTRPNGFAGDAVKRLTKMTSATGLVSEQSKAAVKMEEKYQDDLEKLEDRLKILLARYTKQFSAMDALVGQTNSLKTSLKSSFDGMAKAYE